MAPTYLRLALFTCILFVISFGTAAAAVGGPGESEDDVRTHLLQRKSDEWRILRILGELTRPPHDNFLPPPAAPTFVLDPDGTVVWLGQRYARYVQVASAAQLTKALATVKPGDFIHLLDGLYSGNFVLQRSGEAEQPIALYGSRRAIVDGRSIKGGYGLHLVADYWRLAGFTIRNAGKGLMIDRSHHNLIHGLEIYKTGDEGLHLRSFSSDNLVTKVWVHDTGLVNPKFGEGIYVGSAVSNWPTYTSNQPDQSDRNQIIGNLLGPNLTAEAVDLKEGTSGGVVRNNSFLLSQHSTADSWVDAKGNGYEISHNRGLYTADSNFRLPVTIHRVADGWGQNNSAADNQAYRTDKAPAMPFFVTEEVTEEGSGFIPGAYLVLLARPMPYTLSELAAAFPDAIAAVGADTLLLQANLFTGQGTTLQITAEDAARVRLLSSPERYVNLTGFLSQITIQGSPTQQLDFESWDPGSAQPDGKRDDGRAYLLAVGGRMDVTDAGFFDLGYEEGTVSGVAWKSVVTGEQVMAPRGDVYNSHFVRNYFGAYTFEAVEMRWIGNTFAHNVVYGFDPHDFSNYFHVEKNIAHNNGSHGIIFSRGCDYNVIRENKSYDNQGHGIMLDDGKVIPDSENERHQAAVPSNHNVIEANFVVNNLDGIVLEGGKQNIVRNNLVLGPHRYGLRFTDKVVNSLVVSNTVEHSEEFGAFVYNHSTNNHFQQNTITHSSGGIAFENAPHNTFRGNVFDNIQGVAMRLKGDLTALVVTGNTFSGSGAVPLQVEQMTGIEVTGIQNANDFSRWQVPPPLAIPYFIVSIWSIIFVVPLIMTLRRKLANLFFPT